MNGRVVVVTGASRGIGRAIVERLADDGLQVVGVARSPGPQGAATWIEERGGGGLPIHLIQGDVSEPETADRVVGYAIEKFGRVDTLVNNAGVEHDSAFHLSTHADYRATFDTNVGGFVSMARRVLPIMVGQGGGLLCVVASVCSVRGFAGASVYCGSKFALLGLVDSLQEEYRAEGVRVSAVLPGWVNTDLASDAGLPDERYRDLILQPRDVADAVSYIVMSPSTVVIERLVIRPLVERPYSGLLDIAHVSLIR